MKTAADLVQEKEIHLISVPPDTLMNEVIRMMLNQHIAAMLVEKDGKIVGIWSDRDLLRDILSPGYDPSKAKIGDYMERSLPTAPDSDTIYQLADKFIGKRVRHLLISNDSGEFIGILSVGDVIVNALHEKNEELQQLKTECSWDYYEDWKRWKKKKQ
jgi:CBS domain-containing protein